MWSKLDDGFFRNRKARAAGKDGRALYIAGLCWCGAQLSDGVIATSDLQLIAAEAEVHAKRTARRLVDVGLWEEVDEGWVVHDYHDYNPTAEAELEKRRVRSEAGRKGGLRSRPPRTKPEAPSEPNTEAFASAEPKHIGTPSPSPSLLVESPQSSPTVRGASRDDGRRALIEAAVLELARRDVERYRSEGGRIANPERYLEGCARGHRRETASRLYELAHQHPDWGATQLADHVAPPPEPAASTRRPDWTPTVVPDALDHADSAERARALRGDRQPATTA